VDDYTQALQGGIVVGLASWILLAGVGRSSSVSSMALGVLTTRKQSSPWRWAFLLGLVGGGAFFSWGLDIPHVAIRHPLVLIPAGFLVGFGAVLGSGSASGHAIVGLGRRSKRSLAAVLTFAIAAVSTVLLTSHLPDAAWWASVFMDGLNWLFGR
jgi:uncharacterized membrane protein YedE/YeeE